MVEQFCDGESLAAIAAEFGVKESTVWNHLTKSFQAGYPLPIDRLLTLSTLGDDMQANVLTLFAETVEQHGQALLTPVYDALNEAVSFHELRIMRMIFMQERDDS